MLALWWSLCGGLLLARAVAEDGCGEGNVLRGMKGEKEGCKRKRPHILYLLADDYGWSNFGPHHREPCHGDSACEQAKAEVNTPNLDELVSKGLLLERHYSFRICSPSRNSIQSGRLAVHVNMVNAPVTVLNREDPVSGYAGMPRNMTGMAQKMKDLNYSTHMVGKWDVGMATPEHTPQGRGYDSWIGYYLFANNYWTKKNGLESTGVYDNCLNSFVDFFEQGEGYVGGVRNPALLTGDCNTSTEPYPLCYEEAILHHRALKVIHDHDAGDEDHPLFLFYSAHLIHTPLEVPTWWLDKVEELTVERGGKPFSSLNRKKYAAMVLFLDATIGEMMRLLKKKGMYENTLILFHSDNGGPIYFPGSANNYPLRGGKYSDFEGGVRTNAALGGGWLPWSLRGKKHHGIISIADWYGTFCVIGGGTEEACLSDPLADKANVWIRLYNQGRPRSEWIPELKPIDSVVQWPYILNGTNGRPGALHVSERALLEYPFKLVTGKQKFGGWQGHVYPNCSSIDSLQAGNGPMFDPLTVFDYDVWLSDSLAEQPEDDRLTQLFDCSNGCLFNVAEDPTEHDDLASRPEYRERLERMQVQLRALNMDNFSPDRGNSSLVACEWQFNNGGYYGPFHDVPRGYYSPVRPVNDTELRREIELANTEDGRRLVVRSVLEVVPALRTAGEHQDKCLYECKNRTEA